MLLGEYIEMAIRILCDKIRFFTLPKNELRQPCFFLWLSQLRFISRCFFIIYNYYLFFFDVVVVLCSSRSATLELKLKRGKKKGEGLKNIH